MSPNGHTWPNFNGSGRQPLPPIICNNNNLLDKNKQQNRLSILAPENTQTFVESDEIYK